jgi:FSR family fosmidomycin resistance protein-like MFS transporter
MQLFVLAAVHFLIDMFASMLPAILPAIRTEFELSLSRGGLVLIALLMTSNGVQPLVGHMRANKRKPLFLHFGLILAVGICFLGALPRIETSFPAMVLLAIVGGSGIAIVHPESLRAVHRLKRISPAVGTAVFMAGGFLGFASGGAVSAYLVSRFGLAGLYPLALCPIIGIVLVLVLRVRLAVERKAPNKNDPATQMNRLSFWLIMTMAIPAAISTIILMSLLPTALDELGFELTFGGFSTTMYGFGGAVGSFVWASIARKKGELKCIIATLFFVVPFLVIYLVLIKHRAAIWILFGAGFFAVAAYILMITLSRHAIGLNLGQRMGFMVGGTWALANIVLMIFLPVAERFGTDVVLKFVPLGYLLSGIFGLFILLKSQNPAPSKLSVR